MAEGVVVFLLNKLATLVREEGNLLRGVRDEVEYVREELERMRAFLSVADAMEDSDQEIQVWVKQVRDVAFDSEDVLDRFMIRMGRHHGEGFYGSVRKIFYTINNLNARHQIAYEIKRIQSRVTRISEGHRNFCLKFNMSEQGLRSTVSSNGWYDRRGDALLLEEAQLVGLNKPKQQLIRWLVEGDSRLKVVSVVGMGGLGKTTLVKKVYDDTGVKNHFQSHAWLNVSESFNMEDLLKHVIHQLFYEIKQPAPQGVETMKINILQGVIHEFLRPRKYVIVLDDVWSIRAWEAIKYAFPGSNVGSRVMLTTRFVDIASTSCTETDGYRYTLEPLSEEESWTLFCRKIFRERTCPPHLEEISRSILKRCEGLPLAIVAISGVLATKNKNRVDEWEMLHRSLGVELEDNDKLEGLKNVLYLSYKDLPYYLKTCFLYLSVFPEDHQIECMRLIRLWTAEGFVQVKEGKTLEDVAEGYLNELVNRSLVQVGETSLDGRLKMCRIHDLFRELIVSKSREQNFIALAVGQSTNWPEKVRRFSIHILNGNIRKTKCFHPLRSLLMFGAVGSLSQLSMTALLSGSHRLLKVLDLRGAQLEAFPNEILKLYHLRYLSLRNTKVKMIPSSIRKLQYLETLDLKDTDVDELPVEILLLQGLRHLLVYRYSTDTRKRYRYRCGFKAPVEIGCLSSLQKLCYIEANHGSGGSMMRELGRLNQLKRLGIVKLSKEDGRTLCSSIEKMTNLRSLNITSMENDETIELQSLSSAPRFLQRLYLQGRLENVPHWIPSLHNLAILCLRWSQLNDDPMEHLQDLPCLVHLEFKQTYSGEELCFPAGRFQRLKILWLEGLESLRWVRVENGSMPSLEELVFRNCELLEEVPTGIEHLANLRILELDDMPDKLIMTLKQDRGGGDYWKTAHIPKVWCANLKNGRWIGEYI